MNKSFLAQTREQSSISAKIVSEISQGLKSDKQEGTWEY